MPQARTRCACFFASGQSRAVPRALQGGISAWRHDHSADATAVVPGKGRLTGTYKRPIGVVNHRRRGRRGRYRNDGVVPNVDSPEGRDVVPSLQEADAALNQMNERTEYFVSLVVENTPQVCGTCKQWQIEGWEEP